MDIQQKQHSIFLRVTNDRTLWRSMIANIQKQYDTEKKKKNELV